MHIVGMLMDASGIIDNGSSTSINTAVDNGFVTGTNILATTELSQFDDLLNVYPNPSTDLVQLSLNIKDASDLQVNIRNLMGQKVAAKSYGSLVGAQNISLNVSDFPVGIYTVEVLMNGAISTKQFVKQ